MKSSLGLLVFALVCAASASAETLAERELKRLVQHEREVLATAKADADRVEDSGFQTELAGLTRGYEALIKSDPNFAPAYVAYGLFLNRGGERKRANELFRKADQLEPNLPVVKNQIGNFLAEEGLFAEALAHFEAAARLAPTEALYRYQLGTLLYEYREAFAKAGPMQREAILARSTEAFAKAAALAPDNLAFAYRHAESLADLPTPDWPAALAAWQALEPRAKAGVELQTLQLQQANILLRLQRFDEARALLGAVTEAALQGNKKALLSQLPPTPDPAP